MFKPPRKLIFLALICGVLFIVGMVQLFLLRFEAGNVYPAYSSLRSDPLGTQVLFQSLRRISTDSVRRHFQPLHQVELNADTTLMIIGIKERGFFRGGQQYDKLLESLAQSGGRLVLTYTPASSRRASDEKVAEEKDSVPDQTEPNDAQIEEAPDESESSEDGSSSEIDDIFDSGLSGLRSLGFRFRPPTGEQWEDMADRFYGGPEILPSTIPWRSPLSFELRENSWETLYTWQGEPVVAQRPWGDGKVVMVADSYLLSNEALRNHRFPRLLTWLVQPGNTVIFDESLKGLIKQPGMAGLARQYRLHGVFAALLVLVGLFVWRQSAIFITPVREEKKVVYTQPAAGRDTSQGLVHLSRQHIDAKTLLTICLQAWRGQAAQRVSTQRITEVEAMVSAAVADPRNEKLLKTYLEICELLKQGKHS